MPAQVQITLNLDASSAVDAATDASQIMSKEFTDAAAKTDLAWNSVVNNFKNNIAAYNAAVEQGGAKAKLFNQVMNEGVAAGKTYAQSLAIAATAVREMGVAAETSGAQLNAGLTQNFYKASLLSQELGLGIPRAMERVIAHTPLLATALNAAFPILLAVGFAQMIGGIYDQIISATDAWGGYTDQVKKVYQATIQASQKAFITPETLALTKQNEASINAQIEEINKVQTATVTRNQLMGTSVGLEEKIVALLGFGLVTRLADGEATAKDIAAQEKLIPLLEHQTELARERNKLEDELAAKVNEAGLSGRALADQQLSDFRNSKTQQVLRVQNPEAAALGDAAAVAEYNAKIISLNQDAADQITQMRRQVVLDSLAGEAKVYQQEAYDLDAIKDKLQQDLGTGKAFQQAYAQAKILLAQQTAQKIAQINDQQEAQTESMERAAREASLQGDDLILAHKQDAIKEAVSAYAKGNADVMQYLRRLVAANVEADADIEKSDQQAQQKREATQQRRQQLVADAADRQRDAETAAALASVPPWQKAYAQIVVESDRRIQEINKQEAQQLLQVKANSTDASQIETAAQAERVQVVAEANERIAEENRKNIEQLGNDFDSLFNDIGSGNLGQRILDNMKKLFAEILAAWVLTSQTMRSVFGGLFGTALFGPGSMESQLGGSTLGGGFTNILGSIFGIGSPSGAAVPAGAAAAAAAAAESSGAAAGAVASTGVNGANPLAQALGLGGFFGGNPLTTESLSSAGVVGTGVVAASGGKGLSGLLGGLTQNGLASMGGLLTALLAGKIGGTTGQIGGIITGLYSMAAANPAIAGLLGHLGVLGGLGGALLASVGPALLGFGVGQNFGPLGGALAGGGLGFGAGALIGLAGGPIGAVIGGIIGAIAGLFGGLFGGSKRKKAAEQYFNNQLQPQVQQVVAQFEGFQLDYATAISDLEQIRTQAQSDLGKLKGQGKDVFRRDVTPAINAAEAQIDADQQERTRRSGLVFGPPQFHSGGDVMAAAHSAWMVRPNELLAVLRDGEKVMTPRASSKYGSMLDKMNAGEPIQAARPGHTINLYAFDSKSLQQWLRGGGADEISKALYLRGQEGRS